MVDRRPAEFIERKMPVAAGFALGKPRTPAGLA
jgi:hypothetical protein